MITYDMESLGEDDYMQQLKEFQVLEDTVRDHLLQTPYYFSKEIELVNLERIIRENRQFFT